MPWWCPNYWRKKKKKKERKKLTVFNGVKLRTWPSKSSCFTFLDYCRLPNLLLYEVDLGFTWDECCCANLPSANLLKHVLKQHLSGTTQNKVLRKVSKFDWNSKRLGFRSVQQETDHAAFLKAGLIAMLNGLFLHQLSILLSEILTGRPGRKLG